MNTKEDKFFISMCLDKYQRSLQRGIITHTDFLDERKRKLITSVLNHQKISYEEFYFSSDCEKSILFFGGVDPSVITCFHLENQGFRHQDILGYLFSLGLKEEVIGDIFVEKKDIYFCVLSKVDPLIKEEFRNLHGKTISLEIVDKIHLLEEHQESFTISILSLRLDSILSKIMKKSRSFVSTYLEDGFVFLNYQEVHKKELLLKEGDVLSIRKYGKYKISKMVGTTKKGSQILEIIKYI